SVVVSRRVAGMVAHGRGRAGAAVPGRAQRKDPRDLSAPIAKRHRAVPGIRRARILAARGGPESGDGGPCRSPGIARVLRDGSLCNSTGLDARRCTADSPFIMLAPD